MSALRRANALVVLTFASLSCAGAGAAHHTARGMLQLDTCERAIRVDVPLFGGWQTSPGSALLPVRVSSLETLARIPDATIVLRRDSVEVARIRTDADGEAELRVAPGPYRLEIIAVGFQVTWTALILEATGYSRIELPLWTRPVC